MKTLVLDDAHGAGTLAVRERPDPILGREEVLIGVRAAAVNHIDVSLVTGRLVAAGLLAPAEEYRLGWDVAGEVLAVGGDVVRLAAGDRVIGLRDVLGAAGTHAEVVTLHQSAVALAPRSASFVEAAALPLAGLTALGALRSSGATAGTTLLVTGANGAVGRAVVELASMYDVRVVALGDASDAAELSAAGAAHVLPRGTDLARDVRAFAPAGVDAVVDAAVMGAPAHEALRAGGRFVALVRPFAPAPLRGTSVVVHEASASAGDLALLAALVDAGRLTIRVADTFPLDRAEEAYARAQVSGLRGRVVLVM